MGQGQWGLRSFAWRCSSFTPLAASARSRSRSGRRIRQSRRCGPSWTSPPAIEELPERPPQNRHYVPKQPSNDGAEPPRPSARRRRSRARNWLDSGKTIPARRRRAFRASASLRNAARGRKRRLGDPIEQAKRSSFRRRGSRPSAPPNRRMAPRASSSSAARSSRQKPSFSRWRASPHEPESILGRDAAARPTAPDELDYFPTPPWATRALCEFLKRDLGLELGARVFGSRHAARCTWRGRSPNISVMSAPATCFRYRPEHELADFLMAAAPAEAREQRRSRREQSAVPARSGIHRSGLKVARLGVRDARRTAFAEGQERYHELFSKIPPTFELVFSERVVMLKGRLIRAGARSLSRRSARRRRRAPPRATSGCSGSSTISNGDAASAGSRRAGLNLERAGDYPIYGARAAAAS
jgi:hypothetical protein